EPRCPDPVRLVLARRFHRRSRRKPREARPRRPLRLEPYPWQAARTWRPCSGRARPRPGEPPRGRARAPPGSSLARSPGSRTPGAQDEAARDGARPPPREQRESTAVLRRPSKISEPSLVARHASFDGTAYCPEVNRPVGEGPLGGPGATFDGPSRQAAASLCHTGVAVASAAGGYSHEPPAIDPPGPALSGQHVGPSAQTFDLPHLGTSGDRSHERGGGVRPGPG